jgi:hypothetical protein
MLLCFYQRHHFDDLPEIVHEHEPEGDGGIEQARVASVNCLLNVNYLQGAAGKPLVM